MDLDSDCGPVDIWTCTKHSKDLEGTCVWLAGLGDLATSRGGGEVFFIQSFKIRGRGGQKHRENNGYSEDLFGGRPSMVPELCLRRILLWLKEGGHVANPEQLSCKAVG